CPGEKKTEFLTSVLDALSTDMVHAVTDPASAGRMLEPDPSHTLEERVVHWYFSQLDKNSNGDIGKKEIKPFKRLLRKKSKPKKCVKKFVEYCDINNDKALSLQELMGCLGVTKEEGAKTGEGTTSCKLRNASVSLSTRPASLRVTRMTLPDTDQVAVRTGAQLLPSSLCSGSFVCLGSASSHAKSLIGAADVEMKDECSVV
ncbi:hypothetical protein cypCar_00008346, partial [Cyprinus carpio]